MAETKEELIIEINVEGSVNQLASLRATMDELIKLRQELAEKSKKGDDEAAKKIEETNSKLRNLNTEYKAQQRILDGYSKTVQSAADKIEFQNNSIQQNRDLLKQLTAQYIQLKKPSEDATAKIKGLSDKLKEQEAAIGNTARNVGNYREAIVGAFSELKGLGGTVKTIGELGNAFKSAGGGVNGFSAALATTGLPLIIAGVNLLISAFKSFTPIMEALEDATNAVGAAFNALVSGGSISEAISLTQDYTNVVRDLNDTQESFNLTQQGYSNQIDQLIIKSKDRTKAEKERFDALKKASYLEKTSLDESTKRIDREFEQLRKTVAGKAKLRESDLDDFIYGTEQQVLFYDNLLDHNKAVDVKDIERLQELAVQKAKIFGESNALQERIVNRQNQLQDEIAKQNEKAIADAKAKAEKLKADREKYLANIDSLETQFELNDRQRLEKSFEDKLATITGQSQREIDLRLAIKAAQEEALDKFDADLELKRQQRLADRLVKERDENFKALEELRLNAELQLKLQEQYGLTQEEIDAGFLNSRYFKFKDYYDSLAALYKTDADTYKKEQEAKFQAASSISGAFTALANAVGQQTAEGIAFQKVATGIQIAIDTAKSISAAIAGATQAAAAGGPAAPFLLVGYIAAMIGSVVGAVAQATALLNSASAPTPPKFAGGGKAYDIDGESHSNGGTPIHVNGQYVAEAERGEGLFIMKKDAYQAGKLSNWNQLFGGKSWGVNSNGHAADGGFISIPSDGGFVARSIAREADNAITANAMEQILQRLPTPTLSIVEFQAKQDSRNRSVKVSEA